MVELFGAHRYFLLLPQFFLYLFYKVNRHFRQSGNFINGVSSLCKEISYKNPILIFHIEFCQNIHSVLFTRYLINLFLKNTISFAVFSEQGHAPDHRTKFGLTVPRRKWKIKKNLENGLDTIDLGRES